MAPPHITVVRTPHGFTATYNGLTKDLQETGASVDGFPESHCEFNLSSGGSIRMHVFFFPNPELCFAYVEHAGLSLGMTATRALWTLPEDLIIARIECDDPIQLTIYDENMNRFPDVKVHRPSHMAWFETRRLTAEATIGHPLSADEARVRLTMYPIMSK
jgi:hypothetical protein